MKQIIENIWNASPSAILTPVNNYLNSLVVFGAIFWGVAIIIGVIVFVKILLKR